MVLNLMHVHLFGFQMVLDLVTKVIIFEIDNSFSAHVDNRRKDMLVLGKALQ